PSYQKTPWDGLQIAQWLAAQGCDLKAAAANGTTLLHIAAEAGDAASVRYLLAQGLDASTPGEYGLPALGSVTDEDVALILLEAGTDLSKLDDFARYAEGNHWLRVTAWLKAHPR
ncbi:MAG TPA: ankyrin repeat domain-containing protein, partial [Lysobacter sp.]|nr:ankyrin repeat domain-containing protein [Lysobacter sp.]